MSITELDNELNKVRLGKNPTTACGLLCTLQDAAKNKEEFIVSYADYIEYLSVYIKIYEDKHCKTQLRVPKTSTTVNSNQRSSLDKLSSSDWSRGIHSKKKRSWYRY